MENGKGGKKTSGNLTYTCFLLLEPRHLGNSGETARRIARCRGVREVHVTSGKYAFVVSAGADRSYDVDRISSDVKRASKITNVNVAVSHLVYRG